MYFISQANQLIHNREKCTHVSNFVHRSLKTTKIFRRFRQKIAIGCIKIVVVFDQFIYQLSSLVLEIFFECMVITKFLIFFLCVSIWVFSVPWLKKVCLTVNSCSCAFYSLRKNQIHIFVFFQFAKN